MKTTKSKEQESENRRNTAPLDDERSEQEADRISSRFKNSGDVKGAMSSQLGIDFSGVQVHQDALSHQQTRKRGAVAFTRGNDVFMGSADALSRTGTTQSQVLAHELTHTVQQGAATQSGGEIAQTAPTGAVQMWNPFARIANHFHRKKEEKAQGKAFDQDLSDRLARLSSQNVGADPLEAKLAQLSAKGAADNSGEGSDGALDDRLARLAAQNAPAQDSGDDEEDFAPLAPVVDPNAGNAMQNAHTQDNEDDEEDFAPLAPVVDPNAGDPLQAMLAQLSAKGAAENLGEGSDEALDDRLAQLSAQNGSGGGGDDPLQAMLAQLSAKGAAENLGEGSDEALNDRMARLAAQNTPAAPRRGGVRNSPLMRGRKLAAPSCGPATEGLYSNTQLSIFSGPAAPARRRVIVNSPLMRRK